MAEKDSDTRGFIGKTADAVKETFQIITGKTPDPREEEERRDIPVDISEKRVTDFMYNDEGDTPSSAAVKNLIL